MTTIQLFRRFGSNVRMFPTLALITLLIAISEYAIMALLVSAGSRSITLGFLAATGTAVIELWLAFAIVSVISGNPEAFSRAERIADMVYRFGAPAAPTVQPDNSDLEEAALNQAGFSTGETEEELDEEFPAEQRNCADPNCEDCNS